MMYMKEPVNTQPKAARATDGGYMSEAVLKTKYQHTARDTPKLRHGV